MFLSCNKLGATVNIKALIEYRLAQTDESLKASRVLIKEGLLRPCINRAYYAIFYSVLALLVVDKKETSRHSGAISLFDKEFVKEGIFKKDSQDGSMMPSIFVSDSIIHLIIR